MSALLLSSSGGMEDIEYGVVPVVFCSGDPPDEWFWRSLLPTK